MPLLLPASFRGAPFAVTASEIGSGRRVALHQYPGREEPWAEDLGREARRFRFRGFIVDGDVRFAGGPITLQRALLLAALEKAGTGLLIHPTLGALNVMVTRCAIGEDLGGGRMSNVDIEFVESGKRIFPSILSSSSGLLSAANLVGAGLAVDGIRAIALASKVGGTRREMAFTAATWTTRITELASDATALHRLAAQLPGPYGRFSQGGNVGARGQRRVAYRTATTIADLTDIASRARTAVIVAVRALAAQIAGLDTTYPVDLPAAVTALIAAIAAACADPADAMRLLEQLLIFVSPRPEASTAMGRAFSALILRAAAAQLTLVVGDYQPASSDDAAATIARLGPLLDALATRAADVGEDASYTALRAARAAIVADLRQRGAALPRLRTFTVGTAPSLYLAQAIYRDPARAAELEREAAVIHPLFMPPRFEALAA